MDKIYEVIIYDETEPYKLHKINTLRTISRYTDGSLLANFNKHKKAITLTVSLSLALHNATNLFKTGFTIVGIHDINGTI